MGLPCIDCLGMVLDLLTVCLVQFVLFGCWVFVVWLVVLLCFILRIGCYLVVSLLLRLVYFGCFDCLRMSLVSAIWVLFNSFVWLWGLLALATSLVWFLPA